MNNILTYNNKQIIKIVHSLQKDIQKNEQYLRPKLASNSKQSLIVLKTLILEVNSDTGVLATLRSERKDKPMDRNGYSLDKNGSLNGLTFNMFNSVSDVDLEKMIQKAQRINIRDTKQLEDYLNLLSNFVNKKK